MLFTRFVPALAGLVLGVGALTSAFAAPPQLGGSRSVEPTVLVAQANDLADAIARNEGDWRNRVRSYLQAAYPDRVATTDRAIQLLKSVNSKCLASRTCPPNVLNEIALISKGSVCAAYIIDSVCVRRFTVPRGAQAFDFGPSGQPVYPGMRAVSPGDPRITGSSLTGVRYNDAYPASGDSIIGVTGFKTPMPEGKYRVVLVSGKRPLAQAVSTPFGRTIQANGRSIEVMVAGPDRWLPRGALANGSPEQVFAPNNVLPGSAAAIVFDIDHRGGDLLLQFPQSAEVGALMIEPAGQPSGFVLDSTAQSMGPVSNSGCLEQESRIDRALAELPQDQPPGVRNCPGGLCQPPPPPCQGACQPLSRS
ncbi:hypothetical protein FHP25_15645 [Vineibacter terrae]|uniref:Uncharacterized protein n=1 Tax=Vineibacter terrae TaxID=2586908 RepID=A0A5C8PLE7_9HYPH|nr:hypothetical protein [Vineibacter terrae]TXL74844.1 hypothetical protein FHP25_15645 [Vineibacter terrae]